MLKKTSLRFRFTVTEAPTRGRISDSRMNRVPYQRLVHGREAKIVLVSLLHEFCKNRKAIFDLTAEASKRRIPKLALLAQISQDQRLVAAVFDEYDPERSISPSSDSSMDNIYDNFAQLTTRSFPRLSELTDSNDPGRRKTM
uniref:Uncharacterized protein n=1 Tax=Ditylenchus dipsaci TaxID=166011 RepID=A0A915DH04_9BILA